MNKSAIFALLVSALLFGLIPDAIAGCRINMEFQNSSKDDLGISQFQVKSKSGTWKTIGKQAERYGPYVIKAKGRRGKVYASTFRCKAKRRYRFIVYNKLGCDKNIYYPSATGWTKSININFGDISRHCR